MMKALTSICMKKTDEEKATGKRKHTETQKIQDAVKGSIAEKQEEKKN